MVDMKAKELKKMLKKIPDEAELVISKAFVIDEKDEITGILDIPIIGVATNKENKNEVRFVLYSKDVKECFKPDEVKEF